MEPVSAPGKSGVLQAHSDDPVGVQLIAENVGGQVVENAAIDEEVSIATLRGRKDSGNRDGGAHGLGQRTAGEAEGLKGVEIGGYAAERNGKAVVVEVRAVVGEELAAEEFVDAAVGEQSVAQAGTILEPDGDGLGKLAAILAAAIAEVGVGRLQGEDAGHVVADGDVAHVRRGASCGIESRDQRAHAGA